MISYHFYALLNSRIDPLDWQVVFTHNESGTIFPDDNVPGVAPFLMIVLECKFNRTRGERTAKYLPSKVLIEMTDNRPGLSSYHKALWCSR